MSRRNKLTDEERIAAVQEYLNGDGSYDAYEMYPLNNSVSN